MIAKEVSRQRRHKRIRKKVVGTAARPRLCVYKSLNHIYAQVVDDIKGHTLASASSLDKDVKSAEGHKGNVAVAKKIGQLVASRATQAGVTKVIFDRGGYPYHGRVKALADSAREAGLEF